MPRPRSPSYPNFSLEQALSRIEKAYEQDRTNTLDRETLANHIGYSGISGASDKAIATLFQYGLIEKVSKGEVQVSRLAVDCLYPDPDEGNAAALQEAAFNPELFAHLKERFPDRPSESALKSYLKREGFVERAINPAVSAYLETCSFLELKNAYESAGALKPEAPISSQSTRTEAQQPMQTAVPTPAQNFSGPSYTFADGRVILSGTIRNRQDAEQLETFIKAVMPMLTEESSDKTKD